MTALEIYVFILCMIVLVALTAVFTTMIVIIYRLTARLVDNGSEDRKIITEYQERMAGVPKDNEWISNAIFVGIFCLFFIAFLFSATAGLTEHINRDGGPAIRVVKSSSMARKNEKNEYLFENDLNDQLLMFDLIFTEALPDEYDLELYDIVVYKVDDMLVLHRIVGIQEPNDRHPDERWFILQGDAIENPDRFPVYYDQMVAIYRGVRVPAIGSFIMFMQSPAGYICMTLVILEMIAVPILERELEKKWRARLEHIFIKPKWVRKKRLVTSALKRDDDEYEHTYITWSGSIE